MLRYKNKGFTIEVGLPDSLYSVICCYNFNKYKEKYQLSMWLKKVVIDDAFKIDSQKIDTTYFTSTKDNVKMDICQIIDEMYKSGFFDYYIDRFEYTYKCFDIGNDYMEKAGT